MADKKTLDWLKDLCEQSVTEGRNGRGELMHKIGGNPALSYYFNNVHLLASLSPEQFAEERPHMVEDIERVRRDYEALENAGENAGRLNTVEAELASLRGQLQEALSKLNAASASAKGKGDKVTEGDPPPLPKPPPPDEDDDPPPPPAELQAKGKK